MNMSNNTSLQSVSVHTRETQQFYFKGEGQAVCALSINFENMICDKFHTEITV